MAFFFIVTDVELLDRSELSLNSTMSWNSSYIFGQDNESGWGERYFFTYYTEFGDRSVAAVASEVTVFIVALILSVFANVSIAVCVIRFPDMKTVTNSFVLNLAAADLLFALSIPAVAYSRLQPDWRLGDVACRLVPYVQV
ncbi:G protein-coupled receptor, partial [Oryctes borbonicus]